MRRLVLVRHAKTEQAEPDLSRRLTARGRRDAQELGRWLARNGVVPQRSLVSPATRTVQTWELVAGELATPAEIVVDDRVYAATVDDLLQAVTGTPAAVRTLALVGHNPSVADLTDRWAQHATPRFPTGSVAVFDVDGAWSEIATVEVVLTAFATCRG